MSKKLVENKQKSKYDSEHKWIPFVLYFIVRRNQIAWRKNCTKFPVFPYCQSGRKGRRKTCHDKGRSDGPGQLCWHAGRRGVEHAEAAFYG